MDKENETGVPAALPDSIDLPHTDALAEPAPDSLDVLMSKDPETFSVADRRAIIAALRAERAKRQHLQEAEAAVMAAKKGPKAAPVAILEAKSGGEGKP
jgi:hypothetical protein